MKPATKALLEDAFLQILDNTVFRILVAVVILMVLPTFLVGATPEGIDLLFGWKVIPYSDLMGMLGPNAPRPADLQIAFVKSVQELVVQGFAGTIGVFFCIAATAFFVPRMLEKGAADVLFSRPLSRATLVLSRWFAGVLFVAVLAFLLVGGMHLGFLLRSGHSDPGFLWSALTLVYMFAVIHCLSTMVAAFTRSSIAAILLSLVFFVFNGCIHRGWQFKEYATAMEEATREEDSVSERSPLVSTLGTILDGLHWVLPKTSDADILAEKMRTVVIGPDHVLRDKPTEMLVARDYEGTKLERSVDDLAAQAAVWTGVADGGQVVARIELKRRTRVLSREVAKNGRERVKRLTTRQAADEAQEAQGPATRRESVQVSSMNFELISWSEPGAQGWTRDRAFLSEGDWLYEVDVSLQPDWIDEAEAERRLKSFLGGITFDNAAVGRVDPSTWYAKRFGWTAPMPFNAFVSILTTLLFSVALLAAAVWRVQRTDL